jgi:hypothetical protein
VSSLQAPAGGAGRESPLGAQGILFQTGFHRYPASQHKLCQLAYFEEGTFRKSVYLARRRLQDNTGQSFLNYCPLLQLNAIIHH